MNRLSRSIIYVLVCLSAVVFIGLNSFFGFNNASYDSSCITKTQNDKVSGSSLEPFIKNGTIIRAEYGYYSCNDVQRGDVVLVKYTGHDNALIKIIRALPGDKFELKQEENSSWHILINGEVLTNSAGEPYSFSGQTAHNLKLYEVSYKGILPANSYLVFGDQIAGSTDRIWLNKFLRYII